MTSSRRLKLFTSIANTGSHPAGWRKEGAYTGSLSDFAYFKELAEIAEGAKFHGVFFSDSLTNGEKEGLAEVCNMDSGKLDPLILISALAAVTHHLGFVVTLSTAYEEPFNVARRFASIDHISRGRVGWNIVTSASVAAARNFGEEAILEHDLRYERAQEFVDVVMGLWDSWDDDAFVRDTTSGRYFDPAKVRRLDHKGQFFSVAGPAITQRPVQGHPVLVQAGASGAGRRFAARNAEMLYLSIRNRDDAVQYRADIRDQAAAMGRDPDRISFIAQIMPIIAATEEAAQAEADALADLVPFELKLSMLQQALGGVDLSGHAPDDPLPDDLPVPNTVQSAFKEIVSMARREKLSIGALANRFSSTRGVVPFVGTPDQIADMMGDWLSAGAADGFMLAFPSLPGSLRGFVEDVVPVLRRRGLFRDEYEGETLRDNLGLARPENRNALQENAGGAA